MKEVHTEDQKILEATLHNIVTWANLHLGFQHTYTKKNEESNVNQFWCFRNCGEMSRGDDTTEMASPCALGSQVSTI